MNIEKLSVFAAVVGSVAATGAAQATTTFNYTGTVQTFTATSSGVYDILAFGAAGGAGYGVVSSSASVGAGEPIEFAGGRGAEVGGYINLTKGATLTLLVGQIGFNGTGLNGGGGGGATYVLLGSTLLEVAGAGGGGRGEGSADADGTESIGRDGLGAGASGNGQGGAVSSSAGGGGGYLSKGGGAGGDKFDGAIVAGGNSTGGAGGAGGAGGGAGVTRGGGGGGYTGGGYASTDRTGAGGTSLLSGVFTNVTDLSGVNTSNGYVTIDQVSVVPELSTWTMMLAGFSGLGVLGYRRNKAASVVD